jgi:hypothetical protein
VEALQREFSITIKGEWRHIRCIGHVYNVVTRTLLFGREPDILELKSQIYNEEDAAAAWDAIGVVGHLHNIVK